MSRLVYIILSIVIVASTLLLNTGYYKCYSKKTIHIYSSCCSQEKIEKTCCSSSSPAHDLSYKQKCCDKVELSSFDRVQSIDSTKNSSKDIKAIYFLNFKDNIAVNQSTFFKFPFHRIQLPDKSNIYKLNCTYLC